MSQEWWGDSGDGPDFSDRSELRDAVNDIAGHRNVIDGAIIDVAIWMRDHDDWKGEGLSKPEQFLAFRFGLTTANARRYVLAAARADELPASLAAVRRGELSLDQLLPIVRKVPGWADDQVLSLARRLTVGQINSVIDRYDFARSGPPPTDGSTSPVEDEGAASTTRDVDRASSPADGPHGATGSADTTAPAGSTDSVAPTTMDTNSESTRTGETEAAIGSSGTVVPPDRCWSGTGDDGRWRMHLETSRETGMAIEAAMRDERDRVWRESGESISDAEALANACVRSVDSIDDPVRRDRCRTVVHLNVDGRATDGHGHGLPDAVARHIGCDGLVTSVFHENGRPLSVGRTQRIVPERTRREIIRRDGGCRVPGCDATHHLDIHHVVHWSDHGPTDTWNLVALCGHHHRMHHHGRLGISGDADDPDGLRMTNRHGVDLADAGARPTPPTDPPPTPRTGYRPPLGERLDRNWISFVHPERLAAIAAATARRAGLPPPRR